MPRYYYYECTQGHRQHRYRNATRCNVCGEKLTRQPLPFTQEERYILTQASVLLYRYEQHSNAQAIEELLK